MESIADFEKWIETTRIELEQQVIVLKELAVTFAESDVQLIRRDQVARLRILKSGIIREVEDIKRMESATHMGSIKGALLSGGIAFTLGSLFMAAKGRNDAWKFGARLAGAEISKKVPFGTVLIAVGKEGLPEDLTIIPVSRFARESNKTEPEVEASLQHDGYLLMAPERFAELLDEVEQAVLDGSLSLPVTIDGLGKHIPEGW